MDTLAKRVKSRRLALHLKQAELARMAGLQQSDISKIETGSMHRTTGLLGLAKALQCNPDWLASGEGDAVSTAAWPFKTITPEQIQTLDETTLLIVENYALWTIERRQKADVATTVGAQNEAAKTAKVEKDANDLAVYRNKEGDARDGERSYAGDKQIERDNPRTGGSSPTRDERGDHGAYVRGSGG